MAAKPGAPKYPYQRLGGELARQSFGLIVQACLWVINLDSALHYPEIPSRRDGLCHEGT